jgi:hypothetical protein
MAEVDVLPFESELIVRLRFYGRVKFCFKFALGLAQRVGCMEELGSAFARHRRALTHSKSARDRTETRNPSRICYSEQVPTRREDCRISPESTALAISAIYSLKLPCRADV